MRLWGHCKVELLLSPAALLRGRYCELFWELKNRIGNRRVAYYVFARNRGDKE
jgi:hypothetical protein